MIARSSRWTFRVLLGLAALALAVPGSASAESMRAGLAPRPCPNDPFALGTRDLYAPACGESYLEADPRMRFGLTLVQADPNGGHFDYERSAFVRSMPRPPSDPDEIAAILTEVYGPASLLSRSARSMAGVATDARSRSQSTLDGLNRFTDRLENGARVLLRTDGLPDFRFTSKLNSRYFGVGIEADW